MRVCEETLVGCVSRRVFVLGPAHHVHLTGCALSSTQTYRTPIYDLTIDNQGISISDCFTGDGCVSDSASVTASQVMAV